MLCLHIGQKQNPGASAGIKDGLLAWWDFQANGNDSHATARTLTKQGDPTYAAGKVGNAANFTTDQGFQRASADVLSLQGPRTYAFWAYFTNLTYAHPVFETRDAEDASQIKVALDATIGSPPFNKLAVVVQTAEGASSAAHSTTIAAETWYFVVLTMNPQTGAGSLNINNGTPLTFTKVPSISVAEYFTVGMDAGAFSEGAVDSMAVWGRILTAAEQTALYNEGDGKEYADL